MSNPQQVCQLDTVAGTLDSRTAAAVTALTNASGNLTVDQVAAIQDAVGALSASNVLLSQQDDRWHTRSLIGAINANDCGCDPTGATNCTTALTASMLACLAGPVRSIATGGSTTTLTDTTVNFTTAGVATGDIVVLYRNTGAGQYATITGVTATQLTFGAITTAPDATTRYCVIPPSTQTRYAQLRWLAPGYYKTTGITLKSVQGFTCALNGYSPGSSAVLGYQTMIKGLVTGASTAVLELHGVAYSTFCGLTLQGDSGTVPDHILYVHQDVQPGTGDPYSTTTRNVFRDIYIVGTWKVAGYRLGSDMSTTYDESLCQHFNLTVVGSYSPGSGGGSTFTHGIEIGTGNSGNNLAHAFHGCNALGVQNAVTVNDSGPISFFGGTYQSCDTVWNIPQLTGPLVALGCYSESFLKYIVQQTPGSTTMSAAFQYCTCNLSKCRADTLSNYTSGGTGALDIIQVGGTLALNLTGSRFHGLNSAYQNLTGTSSANGTSTTVQVGGTDKALFGEIIQMTSGACSGEQRRITAHSGGVATVSPAWTGGPPASGDTWLVVQTAKLRMSTNAFCSVSGDDVSWDQGRPDTVFCGLYTSTAKPNPAIRMRNWRECDSSTETRQLWALVENQPNMGVSAPGATTAHGALSIAGIANPSLAPQLGGAGNSGGATSLAYALVYRDALGNQTLQSPTASTTTAQATLSASAPITVTSQDWRADVASFDVLKSTDGGATWAALAVSQTSGNETHAGGFQFTDTGQPTFPYTAPTRNATADLTLGASDAQMRLAFTAAATTPGSVTAKFPVYNASGTLLGYVPVYATIT